MGSNVAQIEFGPRNLRQDFDRRPFGFEHTLSDLDMFHIDELEALAAKYERHPEDGFVAGSAPSPGTDFYAVPFGAMTPLEAIRGIGSVSCRVLLKRPENHDDRFRDLLDMLFRQVLDMRGGLGNEKLVRLQSTILVSSAATTTPFHFDPEIGFFLQIEGEKIYHVYTPTVVSEAELERFYARNVIDIGQASLAGCAPSHEHVFHLGPGRGLHQPQNAPHWVETGASRSISFSFVFETDHTRARGRARSFNYYLRRLGREPAPPGGHPAVDSIKSGAMNLFNAARPWLAPVLRGARGH